MPAALALVLVLSGCGSRQNSLNPYSHQSRDIASLWWWMMGAAWIGLGSVVVLLVLAFLRRNRSLTHERSEKLGWSVVVTNGIFIPIVLLVVVFVAGDIFVIKTTQAPAATKAQMTVGVIGHQWWWEFTYPGHKAVTAGEMHIPVHTPVKVRVATADVIHSFWVPQLNRKIDTIPGQKNEILLDADRVGTYRGQCAEFCGLQHAHMSMLVVAQPRAQFDKWLANESKPARPPTTAQEKRGEQVFLSGPCSACHTIRGTTAKGYVGPDLTHLGSRRTLASNTIPNRKGYLARWIEDNQHIKPGNEMPDVKLSGADLQALLAYLESLK